MKTGPILVTSALVLAFASPGQAATPRVPTYSADGRLQLPVDYREWVYLSSGFDMSYRPLGGPGLHFFDNVFAEPNAYQSFLATGTWPDKTMLVLETRGAQSKGSINVAGNFQGEEVMGVEVHLKDASRFPDQWAFFAFEGKEPAALVPFSADCYTCHAAHAAVDRTFVQFYPTLLPIAKAKGTLSPGYKP